MKKAPFTQAIILILFFLIVERGKSQQLIWARQTAPSLNSQNVGSSVKIDSEGSAITTGYFTGTVDFDPGQGTFNLVTSGNAKYKDVFI